MSETKEIYEKIKTAVGECGGMRAKEISEQIGVDKKTVNHILFSADYKDSFRCDSSFKWYLKTEELEEEKAPFVVPKEPDTLSGSKVMDIDRFTPGDIVRHFKRETLDLPAFAENKYLYRIIGIAAHSETKEKMMVYQALYDDHPMFVRPLDMFLSEVDHEKYPRIRQRNRFEKANPVVYFSRSLGDNSHLYKYEVESGRFYYMDHCWTGVGDWVERDLPKFKVVEITEERARAVSKNNLQGGRQVNESVSEVKRDQYTFVGPSARASAEFYQCVINRGYDGDLTRLAWNSAHKFCSHVIGPNFVSYRHGIICGSNAEEATVFFEKKWEEAFAQCQQFQRRMAMSRVSNELKETVEREYNVTIVVYDSYYY